MTTVELERVARDIVPQVGATGWRVTERGSDARGATIYAVVPIIGGRLDGRPVFSGAQRDNYRLMDILEGRTPTSRRAQTATLGTTAPTDASPGLTEAPETTSPVPSSAGSRPAETRPADAGASPRLCEGCDQPLAEDARPNQRTHDGACRVAAFRRRAATKPAGADADTRTLFVTVSDPDSGEASDAAPRPAAAEPAPLLGAHQRQPDQLLTEAPSISVASTSTAAIPARTAGSERPPRSGEAAQLRLPIGAT